MSRHYGWKQVCFAERVFAIERGKDITVAGMAFRRRPVIGPAVGLPTPALRSGGLVESPRITSC
jgi:hypothetical protein